MRYTIGRHIYANLYDVSRSKLSDEDALLDLTYRAIIDSGLGVDKIKAWSFGGKKGGVSIIALLRESHVAIHTWVEYSYATLDILTYSELHKAWKLFNKLLNFFKPAKYRLGYSIR